MTSVYVPPVTQRKRIPQRAIDEAVERIVEEFHPQKIILFGSYARGNPRPESDVDLLVVMKTLGKEKRMSLEIRRFLNVTFGIDLVVTLPEDLRQCIEWGDTFLQEITTQGKVLYESADA